MAGNGPEVNVEVPERNFSVTLYAETYPLGVYCLKMDKWARSCENVSYDICKQQRCRSACASAQSDQHLCCSLLR